MRRLKTVRRPPSTPRPQAISPVAPSPTPFRCPHAVHRCPSVDSGLDKITVNAFRRQVSQFDTESSGDYDQAAIDNMTQRGGVVVPTTIASRSVELEAIDRVLIKAALHQLEEPIRSAYLLRHHQGWPIEDKDPNVRTISRHFGKTPRTIRNWLSRADELLEAWRGEQR